MSANTFYDPLFVAMTLAEVLEETGRSKVTVDRWIRVGLLPAYWLDGEKVFIRRDVLKLEASITRRKGNPGARVRAKYIRENSHGNRMNLAAFKEAA